MGVGRTSTGLEQEGGASSQMGRVFTPQEMRAMSSALLHRPRRPKSARWIVDQDRDIYRDPVGTFQKAAAPKWAPSSSFGTASRFETHQQAGSAHFRETCGPELGPGYDVMTAFDSTLPKAHTLKMSQRLEQKEYTESRPMRWQEGNQDRTEGTDVNFYPTMQSPCFTAAAKKNYHGQATYAQYSGAFGTEARFATKGGLAGAGHKSHFNAQAGDRVQLRDIRRWPETARPVRREVIQPVHTLNSTLYSDFAQVHVLGL